MFDNVNARRERTLGVAAALFAIRLASSGQAVGCADDACAAPAKPANARPRVAGEQFVPVRPTGRMLVPVPSAQPAPTRAPLPLPTFPPRPVLPGRIPPPEYLPNNEPPVFAPQKMD
jgi:hypothetical protein